MCFEGSDRRVLRLGAIYAVATGRRREARKRRRVTRVTINSIFSKVTRHQLLTMATWGLEGMHKHCKVAS